MPWIYTVKFDDSLDQERYLSELDKMTDEEFAEYIEFLKSEENI